MNTPDSGLDIISKRIFAALLQQLEEEQISGWRAVFAKTILWYYQSPLAFLPDFIPGIGFVDDFSLSQLALWICATNPDVVEKKDLEDVKNRCRIFLHEDNKPLLSTEIPQE
ncbi:MAG: hypothetical protein CL916_13830 [Deltaproteobacteria bacterium]|nr:hypothetical protein [Deltaproteobacteria bacterium]